MRVVIPHLTQPVTESEPMTNSEVKSSDVRCFRRRNVTCGNMKLCSATKDGLTLQFVYYMKIGSQWYQFDIREVAKKAKRNYPVPSVHGGYGLDKIKNIPNYEEQLKQELHMVAAWCQAIGAQDFIERK